MGGAREPVDVELGLRAWKQGHEVHFEPRSAAWHQFSSTITPHYARRHVRAIYERNRLLVHWLHLDTPAEATAHGFFLLLKLLASPFLGRWELPSALAQAVAHWEEVRARREKFRAVQQRELQDVLQALADHLRRPEVQLLTPRTAPARPYPHFRSSPPGRSR